MRSMTGFGTHLQKTSDYEVQVTIKSINGRFLDVKPHLPRAYQCLEAQIKKTAKDVFLRGTVDIYIHRKVLKSASSDITMNLGAAEQWLETRRRTGSVNSQLYALYPIRGPASTVHLADGPDHIFHQLPPTY